MQLEKFLNVGWKKYEEIDLGHMIIPTHCPKLCSSYFPLRPYTDKTDVTETFTSDYLKNAPDIFYEQLASLFRAFLTHGYISPIVKDANGDISSSKNYRGIAISSLILKVFDNCLLILFGHILSNDPLQYGFQKGSSTVQCTWSVQETI